MSMPLLARVQANVPAWAHEQLAAWDAAEFAAMSDFITEHYWTGQGSINVYRIVGTDHPQYAGMTGWSCWSAVNAWTSISRYSKRIRDITRRQSNSMPG